MGAKELRASLTHDPPSPRMPPSTDLRSVLALVGLAAALSAAAAVSDRNWPVAAVSLVLLAASGWRIASAPPPVARGAVPRVLVGAAINLSVLTVALGLSGLAAEGAVRWLYRDVTTTADFRGYFTTRWMRAQVRHNHYQYRGAEFDEVRPPGIYRVAVMGDSFTYGNGVPEDRRFSNLLGAALRPRGIEVLNFGFPGNNWPEHVKTLERRILRLRPDFVLLQWGINDVELDSDVAARPLAPPLIANRAWHDALHERSALYTMLNAQWVRTQLTREMGDAYPGYMTRLYADPGSPGAVQAATLMRRFIALARARNVGVGVLLFPDATVSLGPDYPYRFLHERVQAICDDEHTPCVDLLPRLAVIPDRFTLWASSLDAHPSILANQIAAQAIEQTLAPQWGHMARRRGLKGLVDGRRIELLTSALRTRRSPS